jgi:hypothetical protein
MRLDEPQLMVDGARYLSEEIGGVHVAHRSRLTDRLADGLTESRRRRCDGEDWPFSFAMRRG